MTETLELEPGVSRQVHDFINGKTTQLEEILTGKSAARWSVPVTSANVHSIESLFLLAAERRIRVQFKPSAELNDRERAFLDDFLRHCVGEAIPVSTRMSGILRETGTFASDCCNAVLRSLWKTKPPAGSESTFATALLIGAYGGEHVGDAAILGGILIQLHEKFGTREANVFSHRPQHTARLAKGLSTPVKLLVHPYEMARVEQLMPSADALILAGGPLMDLPRVLVKHLGAVGAAGRHKKPVLALNIGVGPFKRDFSRWLARCIARRAVFVSVRTAQAAADPILNGIPVKIARDPAFEYLASRTRLSLLSDADREQVAALLNGVEGRVCIGINLRPIRHIWSTKGDRYSREAENRFYERFAEGLIRFASAKPVTYVFFPMNPIQLGSSDLAAAYRLHRLVGDKVDFRVWEADPDVDAVLHLLRQLDGAVTMRLHAGIFCLSQNLPVLGIDYYPGQGGKVEHMFNDEGRGLDVCRMDEMEPEWLVSNLAAKGGR